MSRIICFRALLKEELKSKPSKVTLKDWGTQVKDRAVVEEMLP